MEYKSKILKEIGEFRDGRVVCVDEDNTEYLFDSDGELLCKGVKVWSYDDDIPTYNDDGSYASFEEEGSGRYQYLDKQGVWHLFSKEGKKLCRGIWVWSLDKDLCECIDKEGIHLIDGEGQLLSNNKW